MATGPAPPNYLNDVKNLFEYLDLVRYNFITCHGATGAKQDVCVNCGVVAGPSGEPSNASVTNCVSALLTDIQGITCGEIQALYFSI